MATKEKTIEQIDAEISRLQAKKREIRALEKKNLAELRSEATRAAGDVLARALGEDIAWVSLPRLAAFLMRSEGQLAACLDDPGCTSVAMRRKSIAGQVREANDILAGKGQKSGVDHCQRDDGETQA